MGSFGEAGEPANSIAKEEAPSFCSQSLQNEGASQEGLLRRGQRVTVKGEVHSLSYVIPLVVREGEGVSPVILADDDTPRLGVTHGVADVHLNPTAHGRSVRRAMGLLGDATVVDTVRVSDYGENTKTDESHHGEDDDAEEGGQNLAVFPHIPNEVHYVSPEMIRTAVLS